ncbi:MAG: PEGA domain-containing protein [Butyrivibrio sp.]|uniref:PEGA domain-containing protein n=1 Tax=Butyrivibrio sp. TaxID=28121 RepID=UPI001B70FDBA|nr:PEGA domain-containing protein [Butyrivibrio sp.]MBP3277973.1 PEGA domain-containing protein [Butyrivibrio sp.]MBP3783626.1 PEGA domain-containing protein [Butyrivibrio sp.]
MFRTRKALKITISGVLLMAMLVSSPQSITYAAENADKVSVSLIGKYDSFDTAAIRDIDTVKKQIRFRNHKTGKTYTLSYDNTSMIYDVRGTALSAALLEVGQIVDVKFLKSSKHITSLNVSSEAWTVEDTREHELVRGNGTAKVKGELYRIDPKTLVMADGNIALAEDVLSTDKVTVSGIGKDIYSVVVTSGHGYVSLSSDTVEDHSLVGSWIELDNEVIYKISPNMLLSAPEGDYTLQILGNGASYTSEVNVSRNQETVVDTSNVNITKPKEGLVTFEIIPDTAEVFVDGEKVLTGVPQSIKYGYHNLKIIADGYKTQDKYLKIGTAKSVISIEMEKDKDDSADSSSGDTSSDSDSSNSASSKSSKDTSHDSSSVTSASAATTAATVSSNSSEEKPGNKVINGYYIYFDKPYAAELYFDGAYIGMIPTHVPKISGTHEVILKMEGYETKSYRISIDKDEVDLNYTFPDLVKHKSDDEESSSGSSSSAASSASSDDSSSADSASTGDSASGDDSATDASSAEDTSTEDSSTPSEDSTKESSLPSEDASIGKSSETGQDTTDGGEDESTNGNSNKETADAASTASASGD